MDGRSDVIKLIVTFCNFANMSEESNELISIAVWKVLNSCCSDRG